MKDIEEGSLPFIYFGLPLFDGRSKKDVWAS